MDPNLWNAENTRLNDVFSSASLSSAGTLSDIQGNLTAIAGNLSTGANIFQSALARQDITYNIVQTENNRLNAKKNSVDNAYASSQRIVQLNNNYQKRYWDYTKIIMIWATVLALYFILNLLVQYFPVIPSILVDILVIIGVIVAAIYSFMIYNTLNKYDLMNYGLINQAPPALSKDEIAKDAADLKNAGNLPTDPRQLACLKAGYFYDSGGNCYKDIGTTTADNISHTMVGLLNTPASDATKVTLQQGFQNIEANGEYEFQDYQTYK